MLGYHRIFLHINRLSVPSQLGSSILSSKGSFIVFFSSCSAAVSEDLVVSVAVDGLSQDAYVVSVGFGYRSPKLKGSLYRCH